MRSTITGPSAKLPADEWPSSQAIQNGVASTPIRLDSVALKIATGTLPRAATVSATDDETVDGSAQR